MSKQSNKKKNDRKKRVAQKKIAQKARRLEAKKKSAGKEESVSVMGRKVKGDIELKQAGEAAGYGKRIPKDRQSKDEE